MASNVVRTVSTVITSANGFSAGIPIQDNELVCGVQIDASWDANIDIGVDISQDNITFFPIVDPTNAGGTSDYRFINLPNGTAVINVLPEHHLPFPPTFSFFRLRGLNVASNVVAKPAADRTVIAFIAKVND